MRWRWREDDGRGFGVLKVRIISGARHEDVLRFFQSLAPANTQSCPLRSSEPNFTGAR